MGIQDRDYMRERHRGAEPGATPASSRKSRGEWLVGGMIVGAAFVLLCLLAIPLWRLWGPHDWRPAEESPPSQPNAQQAPSSLPTPLQNILPETGGKSDPVASILPQAKPAQPFPSAGSVVAFQELAGQAKAGFTIDATATGRTHHVIKVEEWNTQRPVLMTFVPGSTTVKVDLPLGIYRIKIASGDTWYGMDELFGPGTRVQTGEKPLQFYMEGNAITGHTLRLQSPVSSNNFPTAEGGRRSF